jgi:nicotinamidase-related amidase
VALPFLNHARGRRELPELDRAALVLVDLQRLFVDPASPAWVRGWEETAPRARRLARACAARGWTVAATRHVHSAGDDGGVMGCFFERLQRDGDVMSELLPELCDWAPDLSVVSKARFSALSEPSVAAAAEEAGVVLLAGVQTHLCVLASALDAASRGVTPVVVADACAARTEALHQSALRVLAAGHSYVATVDEVIAAMSAGDGT